MCWKGTATFRDGHTYTGSMRNGKMHGEGKFTWKDGTVYEGKFRKNEITGYGKYNWPDGTSYVGDVKDGIRHGKGVFTNPKENYKYDGEWKSGLRHGKGTLTYQVEGEPDMFTGYEGSWKDGEKSGFGKYFYPSGNRYEGEWLNNKRNGKGTMFWQKIGNNPTNEKYVGQWKDDLQSGFGTHIWLDEKSENKVLRNRYVGYWKNGVREGHGIFFYANGSMYIGQWRSNMKDGWGKFVYEDGSEFEGYFSKDRMLDKSVGTAGKTLTAGIQAAPDIAAAQALQKEIEKVAKAVAPKPPPAKGEKQPKEVAKQPPPVRPRIEVESNPYNKMIDCSDLVVMEQLLLDTQQQKQQASPSKSPGHPGQISTKPKEIQEEVSNIMLTHHSELKQWYKFFTGVDRIDFEEGFMMVARQFWRLLAVCKVLNPAFTLAQFDRIYLKGRKTSFSLKYNPFDGVEGKREGEWRPTTTESEEISKKENKTGPAVGGAESPIKLVEAKKDESMDKAADKSGITPVHGRENSHFMNMAEEGEGNRMEYEMSDEELPIDELETLGREDVHDPLRPLLFRHFAEAVIRAAYLYYVNEPGSIKAKLSTFFNDKLKPGLPEVAKRGKKKDYDAPKPGAAFVCEEMLKPFEKDIFDIFKLYSRQAKHKMERFSDYTITVKTFVKMAETTLGKEAVKFETLLGMIDGGYSENYATVSRSEGPDKSVRLGEYVRSLMSAELIFYEYKGLILELIRVTKKVQEIKEDVLKGFVDQWVTKLKRKVTKVRAVPRRMWTSSEKDVAYPSPKRSGFRYQKRLEQKTKRKAEEQKHAEEERIKKYPRTAHTSA